MTTVAERPVPFLVPEYCKGCGRCIGSCIKGCITAGTAINAATGLVPVVLDLTQCNGCGLCIDACPEPFGLRPHGEEAAFDAVDASQLLGPRPFDVPSPEPRPDAVVPLPERQ